jgi:hypothetical protein
MSQKKLRWAAEHATSPTPEVDAHMKRVVEAWIRANREFKLWRMVRGERVPAREFFKLGGDK